MRLSKLPAWIAAVLCGGLWANASASVFSQELTTPGDFSGGIFERTEVSEEIGGVILNRSFNCVPFLWVPSTDEGVVSKIDARSGAEIARYRTGPTGLASNPCAVATDYAGNAFVACSGPGVGRIVKICASGATTHVERAAEHTSFDTSGVGSSQALPWGKDSRVCLLAEVGSAASRPSALAFGADGLLWVGLSGEQSMVAVDTAKGTVVHTTALPGNPDTVIAGSNGFLWVLCGDVDTICEVNTLLGTIARSYQVPDCGLRSMALGKDDLVWLASDTGLVCVNTTIGSFTLQRLSDGAGLTSITTDKLGDVWASCPTHNELIRFSMIDQRITGRVAVGLSPNAVCVDGDGYIWSLNEENATASRVDPRVGKLTASVRTGRSPFSSTPFAASALKRGTCPSGSWRKLFDSKVAGAGWGALSWAEASCGGHLNVEVRSADVPTALEGLDFIPVMNGQEAAIPNGQYLEVRVSLVGGDNTSPVLQGLSIQGRNLPPDVSRATPSLDRIAKLDHSLQTVAITGVSDPEGDPVTISVTSVTQDEPVYGLCPNDKAPDALGIGQSEVKLRAECDPGTADQPGNGRTYTVTFKASDPYGASTTGTVKVIVPPVLLWDAIAVDDHKKYDSTKEPEKDRMAKA